MALHRYAVSFLLGFMCSDGGPVTAPVLQTHSASLSLPLLCTLRRMQPSLGLVPLVIPVYIPPGASASMKLLLGSVTGLLSTSLGRPSYPVLMGALWCRA